MRSFRNLPGRLCTRSAATFLSLFLLTALLFDSGCSGLAKGSSSGGATPPSVAISNVATTIVTMTSVTVTWQTNVPANSQVEYGTSSSYGSFTALDGTMVTSHQETISGLKPGTLYHYRVHSAEANGSAVSGDQTLTTAADTTPPSISITSPSANATLAGTVTLMATATDNVAVATVQFKVDNASTGPALTSTPYNYFLNTTTLTKGNHTLTAVATDTSGNSTTSAAIVVNISNTGQTPSISGLSPTSGLTGTPVVITGANFGASQGSSTVTFHGTAATPTSWSATSITVPVPTGATTGNVVVTVSGVASSGVSFTVTAAAAPVISSLNPSSGTVGTAITVTGTNFGASQGSSTVTFHGAAATPTSWSATSITVPVPTGATTGNVVVTVSGVASNGVNFIVQADTTAPTVTVTAPANNAAVSGTITLTATATDPDSPVSFVQFLVDGSNSGPQLTSAPYSTSLDTTTLANGSHAVAGTAQDPSGNNGASVAVTINVSNSASSSMGPLVQSTTNPHYFVVSGTNKAVLLGGSQTWNSFQDTGNNGATVTLDFNAYVTFLEAHGDNATILWRKDLPTYCNWGAGGGDWLMGPWPWPRSGGAGGTQMASDGLPAFDLSQFNQAYFDRLRARTVQLQSSNIYAIVELFDGLGLSNNRCSNDGYPFTGGNNVNGIDDGGGTNSMTMTAPNAITNIQDAYVKKVIDTVHDLPNVLYETSEEAPASSWWEDHMSLLIHTYEQTTYGLQHPVGIGAGSYGSNADWVAPTNWPSPTSSCGGGTPACKVNINDSDHSYYGMWNDTAQQNRKFIWENFTNGADVLFMDPYLIYWSSGNRNLCDNSILPVHGVCTAPDSRWDNFRDNIGAMLNYGNTKLDLVKMTPQPSLSSTGFCLTQNVAVGAEFIVYFPNGGQQTVDLSLESGRTLNVEWFDPANLTYSAAGTVSGGSVHSFTPPWGSSYDAVLYLVDSAGHN
jgi:Bacterial Ig domain/IPT/TIG domain/Purple acid Phosphatase, N-terminal domain/Putative collagen-binding domain of a collagenase